MKCLVFLFSSCLYHIDYLWCCWHEMFTLVLLFDQEGGRIVMSNPSDGRLELLVRDLVPGDMSNYTCRSANRAGFHEKNGTITVNCKWTRVWSAYFVFTYLQYSLLDSTLRLLSKLLWYSHFPPVLCQFVWTKSSVRQYKTQCDEWMNEWFI